jgi:hypothetical protein
MDPHRSRNGNLSYLDLEQAPLIVKDINKKPKAKKYEHNYNKRWQTDLL